MCYRLLGPTIDIHAGGVDLVFPHHQNEVAQSEAFTGKQFSKYWMHNGFVNINNEKMSKSLKNFKTLRDIVSEPIDARAFRYMVVTSQYRNPLNFNAETLKSAKNSLKRIDKLVARLRSRASEEVVESGSSGSNGSSIENEAGGSSDMGQQLGLVGSSSLAAFERALCDDLNTPKAVAALFKIVGAAEKCFKQELKDEQAQQQQQQQQEEEEGREEGGGGRASAPPPAEPGRVVHMSSAVAQHVLSVVEQMDAVFGVLYEVPASYFNAEAAAGGGVASAQEQSTLKRLNDLTTATRAAGGGGGPHGGDCDCEAPRSMDPAVLAQVQSLAQSRADMKAQKNYAEADKLRDEIAALGYGVKDVHGGGFDLFVL